MARGLSRRPQKSKNIEPEQSDRLTPGRIPAVVRGWMMRRFKKIDLRHVNENGSVKIDSWDLFDNDGDEENAEVIAHQILSAAQEEGEAMGGYQRFTICGFDGTGTAWAAQRSFEVRSDGEASDDSSPTEDATPKGIAAQAQRHVEQMTRIFTSAFSDVQAMQHQISESVRKENERLRERDHAISELRESLMAAEHERILDMNREARKDQMVAKGLEMANRYIPVIVGRLATGGKKGEKLPPMLAEEQVKQLLTGVMGDPEYLANVAQVLKPEHLAILSDIARQHAETEEENARKEAPPKVTHIESKRLK
jgi:hypothetical protein